MIVLDIETSGLNPEENGIWQIGAFEFENPVNSFIEEARIDDKDKVDPSALVVTGKTEKELRDKKKQSQKELLEKFFEWVEGVKIKNCICQNPQFDVTYIQIKAEKYGLNNSVHYRSFDLHSIAQLKHLEIHNKFLIAEKNGRTFSDMGLSNILKFCGMKDTRRKVEDEKMVSEGKPHNALEDARLTGECFSRIVYGKVLFEEYEQFPLPYYLEK